MEFVQLIAGILLVLTSGLCLWNVPTHSPVALESTDRTDGGEEGEPLLPPTHSTVNNDMEMGWTAIKAHYRAYSTLLKTVLICILLTLLAGFILDCLVIFKRDAYNLAASALMLLSWIIVLTLVCLMDPSKAILKSGTPLFIRTYLTLASTFELVLFGIWISNLRVHPEILSEWDCIAKGSLQTLRLTLLICLGLASHSYRVSTRVLMKSLELDTSISWVERMQSNWQDTKRKLRRLMPFVWPKGFYLQFLVLCCFVLLFFGRIVNVLVPYTYKVLVDKLSPGTESDPDRPYFAWGTILAYTFFRFLQGGVGVLNNLQSFLWIPGEVLRVMNRGTESIGALLSYIAFNIIPVFIDIGLAVIYFFFTFDSVIASIVFLTMALYIFFTVWITEWRTKFRRLMNDLDNAAQGRAVDSLLNFETVKYFGNEKWEVGMYQKAIEAYQVADYESSYSLNLLNTAQNSVITIGLLAGLMICAKRVVDHQLSVGDFVAFIAYILQLYQPLNSFGTYYRVIQKNFIDMEMMLDLLEQSELITDDPEATELVLTKSSASVVFDHVSFSYDEGTPILKDVSFQVPAGKTVALVGPTGSGKSTVLRLLFRFYDVTQGVVTVEGQDIRKITQKSLRKHIGVVPQDTVLFNESIQFNIRYGKVDATDEEIVEAAQASQIHDKILTFADGYNTKVGERGLRLSGGEKQRVAIARTLLKNPPIILLDEATSALDNTTERMIQASLDRLSHNRTTIVVAHRLSTVVDADEILVLKNGVIVERGTHNQLLLFGSQAKANGMSLPNEAGQGTYYGMWHRQLEEAKSTK